MRAPPRKRRSSLVAMLLLVSMLAAFFFPSTGRTPREGGRSIHGEDGARRGAAEVLPVREQLPRRSLAARESARVEGVGIPGATPAAGSAEQERNAMSLSLLEGLGLTGGIDDLDYFLELLRPGAGREELALAVRLLEINRDLESFPEAVIDRILVEPDGARLRSGGLLLDLSLRLLCSLTCTAFDGRSSGRFAVDTVLTAYESLYRRLGEALSAITGTISRSGCIGAEDLQGLLGLAQRVPSAELLVRTAAGELADSDPAWARRQLFNRPSEPGLEVSLEGSRMMRMAALEELAPLDALDYIVSTIPLEGSEGLPGGKGGAGIPQGAGSLCRRGVLRGIARRAAGDELFQWLRASGDGVASRLLISVLSPRVRQELLSRLAHSNEIEDWLRGAAVVKLAGIRASEATAALVLGLRRKEWPGHLDLFVQASENLLLKSAPSAPWVGAIVLQLEAISRDPGVELPDAVRADVARLLARYRDAR